MEGFKLIRTLILLILLALFLCVVFFSFQNLLDPKIGLTFDFEESINGTFPCMTLCMNSLDPTAKPKLNSFEELVNHTSILDIIEIKLFDLTTR